MPLRQAATPRRLLYRLGHMPNPLAWPPRDVLGDGRFDDPRREFRVLYATQQRRGVFVETLARFRPSLELLAELQQVTDADEPVPIVRVPTDWYQKRGVACLRLAPRQRWLDLRAPTTREALRGAFAGPLLALGFTDLDLGGMLGPRRELTQAIARWTYERGYAGLAYRSRLDERLTCWAIFEGALFEPGGFPSLSSPMIRISLPQPDSLISPYRLRVQSNDSQGVY